MGTERKNDEMRKVTITTDVNEWAEGSAIVEFGKTRVLCTASVEKNTPPFLANTGKGWVTAEYSMLPRSTNTRTRRERGKPASRSLEIQRLIGRSLRAVTDMTALGEMTIIIDCDVLQADGGTRTASITGGFVALALAVKKLKNEGLVPETQEIIKQCVAAVSVGSRNNELFLDLDYELDSTCDVDMNCVVTEDGRLVEIQGTAEGEPFSREDLSSMIDMAATGLTQVFDIQKKVLGWK